MVACILFIRLSDSDSVSYSLCNCIPWRRFWSPCENSVNTQWQVYNLAKSTHIHRWQPDYDYRLFIPPLFATNTHVCVFGLALIPCLQLISHDFIHVYSQEKLFNAFECKQASDESTQTPPKTHTLRWQQRKDATFSFFYSLLAFHRIGPLWFVFA